MVGEEVLRFVARRCTAEVVRLSRSRAGEGERGLEVVDSAGEVVRLRQVEHWRSRIRPGIEDLEAAIERRLRGNGSSGNGRCCVTRDRRGRRHTKLRVVSFDGDPMLTGDNG